MTKVSKCFICGGEFSIQELGSHEKMCLQSITSNDVQYTREETKEIAPDGNPQYETCHLCGKLYSKHSMDIHIRQCEVTREKQKTIGTAADNKTKSRSLADLSEGKFSYARPPLHKPVSKIPVKKTTGSDASKENKDKSPLPSRSNSNKSQILSSSLDNLTISRRKDMYSDEVRRKNIKDDKSNFTKENFYLSESNQNSMSSTGLQKCYLCRQMYSAHSLPIHEKQCYEKLKRSKEDDISQKKKGEIKVAPCKRSK